VGTAAQATAQHYEQRRPETTPLYRLIPTHLATFWPRPAPLTNRGGAVCFPQRFGGSLHLNVHYHVAVPDGAGLTRLKRHAAPAELLARPQPDPPSTLA